MSAFSAENIEKLAAIEHQRWSDWQTYLHGKCEAHESGGLLIPAEIVRHWKRQIDTPYEALNEREKQSDRIQVQRWLPEVEATLAGARDRSRNLAAIVLRGIEADFAAHGVAPENMNPIRVLQRLREEAASPSPANREEMRERYYDPATGAYDVGRMLDDLAALSGPAASAPAATITGAEFRDFLQNHWPGNPGEVWHEDSEYRIEDENGVLLVSDEAVLELRRLGYLQYGLNGASISFEQTWEDHLKRLAQNQTGNDAPLTAEEHLQNVMGHVDTPIGRRRLNISEEQPEWLTGARAFLKDAAPASYQDRVDPWLLTCFGEKVARDPLERGDRLIEEAFELLQATDYPRERAEALIGYTWSREKGDPQQEVGGVMVTLAAFCLAHGMNMHEAGERELARVWTKVEKIREKQARKPSGSALPQAWPVPAETRADKAGRLERDFFRMTPSEVDALRDEIDQTDPEPK